MKLAAVAFTQSGAELATGIAATLGECEVFAPQQYATGDVHPMPSTLSEWAADAFVRYDGILFVCACGIAVRAIAPYVNSKLKDPAVVVVDERGQFAISLLSGHVGGANLLAKRVAEAIDAQPVITTATDVRGLFAVDSWAVAQGLHIYNPNNIKEISGALLHGEEVGLSSDFEVKGELPRGMAVDGGQRCGVRISCDTRKLPFEKTLLLVPVAAYLGIGCRKGVAQSQISDAIADVLERHDIVPQSIAGVASIDLKAQEAGLLAYCESMGKPLITYSAEQLAQVRGEIQPSEFVASVTGVDNVCERAALLCAGADARLLVKKQMVGPVTVALAAQWSVRFK